MRFIRSKASKFLFVAVLAIMAFPVFAAEPVSSAEYLTAGTGLIDDFALTFVITAFAIAGLGMFLLRRAKSAVR